MLHTLDKPGELLRLISSMKNRGRSLNGKFANFMQKRTSLRFYPEVGQNCNISPTPVNIVKGTSSISPGIERKATMDPTNDYDIDPITEHQMDNVLAALAERIRAVHRTLRTLPPDDERRDLLAPLLRRWSGELEQVEQLLDL